MSIFQWTKSFFSFIILLALSCNNDRRNDTEDMDASNHHDKVIPIETLDATNETQELMILMEQWEVPYHIDTVKSILRVLRRSDKMDKAVQAETLIRSVMLEEHHHHHNHDAHNGTTSLTNPNTNHIRKCKIRPYQHTYRGLLYAWSSP